jgi:hypothetical protein
VVVGDGGDRGDGCRGRRWLGLPWSGTAAVRAPVVRDDGRRGSHGGRHDLAWITRPAAIRVEFEAASGRPGGARRCRQVELAATGCRPGGARGGGRSGGGEVEGKAAASGWNESALGF